MLPKPWKQVALYINHGEWNITIAPQNAACAPWLLVETTLSVLAPIKEPTLVRVPIHTFIETCKFNMISAYEYIKKMLILIGDEKENTNDYSALHPSVLTVK